MAPLQPPDYDSYRLYGPFHRREGGGHTQDTRTVRRQLHSGEIWGRPSRFSGDVPLVQAHRGRLPEGTDGIEFLSFAIPDKLWGPPEWRSPLSGEEGDPLVWHDHDDELGPVVKIKVAILRVGQQF